MSDPVDRVLRLGASWCPSGAGVSRVPRARRSAGMAELVGDLLETGADPQVRTKMGQVRARPPGPACAPAEGGLEGGFWSGYWRLGERLWGRHWRLLAGPRGG